jgi:hypothetical protein
MCTVSIVAADGLVRIVANRDEQRTRAAAAPPVVYRNRGPRAVFPVDPDGGGTWIGVNETGLAVALLNRNGDDACATPVMATSRGAIARTLLLDVESLDEAIRLVSRLEAHRHAPYRLVMVHKRGIAVVAGGGGETARVSRRVLWPPEIFASSSLGDHLVEGARRRLFLECLHRVRDPLTAQRIFHRHSWADRGAMSVVMHRSDARTVSRTQLDLRGNEFRVDYEEVDDAPSPLAIDEVGAC